MSRKRRVPLYRQSSVSSPPLDITYTEEATQQIVDAYRFMEEYGAADQWMDTLYQTIHDEAVLQSVLTVRREQVFPEPPAPPYARILFRTSGGSPWHIGYILEDNDGDGTFDTLNVISVRHAAAMPR